MILQTGSRTDIPAFYADWFFHRIRAGFVDVRNPFAPVQVTRYRIDPVRKIRRRYFRKSTSSIPSGSS